MQKYGYKNISNMNDIEQSSKKEGKHDFTYNSGKFITHNDFIKWGEQNQWGAPGQSKYSVKDVNALLRAGEKVSTTKQ